MGFLGGKQNQKKGVVRAMGLPSPADPAEKVCALPGSVKMPKGLVGGRLEKGEVKTTQKGRTGLHPPLGPQGTVLHCSGDSKQGKCVCTTGVTLLSVGAPAGGSGTDRFGWGSQASIFLPHVMFSLPFRQPEPGRAPPSASAAPHHAAPTGPQADPALPPGTGPHPGPLQQLQHCE